MGYNEFQCPVSVDRRLKLEAILCAGEACRRSHIWIFRGGATKPARKRGRDLGDELLIQDTSSRAVSSVGERLPYKQVVTGSNPVPPTTPSGFRTLFDAFDADELFYELRDVALCLLGTDVELLDDRRNDVPHRAFPVD